MSLDIIHPKDVPRGKVMYPKDELLSLTTQDIRKARPTYDHLRFLDKPDLSVGCTDPEHAGGRARSYYPPMDRRPRDLSLTTADIEYAQPKCVKWKGFRHTDPVCPVYDMPASAQRLPTPPRSNGRHAGDNSDIEKSQPKVLHPRRNYDRDPNEARDIEFASANYEERLHQRTVRERPDTKLNVRDITHPPRLRPRDTNPLEPVYKVPTNRVATTLHATFMEEISQGLGAPAADVAEVGEVLGSKPRKLTWDNGEPLMSLLREDIAGAVPQRWVGTIPVNIYDPPEVTQPISFHDPHDVPGAQVGTLRKGIVRRNLCLNPLNPRYPTLDGRNPPPSVPVIIDTERGRAHQTHPLMQARVNSCSLPDIHTAPYLAPSPHSLQRDLSAGTLRRPTFVREETPSELLQQRPQSMAVTDEGEYFELP